MIRNLISRVCERTRRSKPCGCAYPRNWNYTAEPEATRVDDGAEETTRETDAAVITEWKRTETYRCHECGDTYQLNTGAIVERDVNWKSE